MLCVCCLLRLFPEGRGLSRWNAVSGLQLCNSSLLTTAIVTLYLTLKSGVLEKHSEGFRMTSAALPSCLPPLEYIISANCLFIFLLWSKMFPNFGTSPGISQEYFSTVTLLWHEASSMFVSKVTISSILGSLLVVTGRGNSLKAVLFFLWAGENKWLKYL